MDLKILLSNGIHFITCIDNLCDATFRRNLWNLIGSEDVITQVLRVEKLTIPCLLKTLPSFYETRRLICLFTTAQLLSLSRASRKKPMFLHSSSPKSRLILSPTYASLLFRSDLPTKMLHTFLFCPMRATRPTRPRILNLIIWTFGEEIHDWMGSYHDGMAHPLVAEDGDGHQMWRVGVSTLDKQSRTAGRGWSLSLDDAQGANDCSP